MFDVSRAAADEVRRSIDLNDADGMGLRIAAQWQPDGGISYRMGFDERAPGDLVVQARGIDILIASGDRTLLEGASMDFVEIEDGQRDFIFLNPNDPHFTPPHDLDEHIS